MTRKAASGALAALLALVWACEAGAAGQARPSDAWRRADTASGREALARVAYAEAAGQGDSGLAGVVYTILNRLGSGRWGDTIEAVVNARGQFEPVMRAGGDWRSLPRISPAQQARIDTMINLALDGRLPDLTGGALYFQNPRIVAARAAAGAVSPRLVNFGGAAPSAVIGDHAFYPGVADASPSGPVMSGLELAGGPIFPANAAPAAQEASPATAAASRERGLFVRADGVIVEDRP